ncbi:MBL fold metallo-hydrolase [Nitratireductor sp. CAU 1489]|uniref:MBL fold metallo-hydrolase n=1 Tax=Nitratireductor arenosus TaxID=2682096 RepID=A0A844QGR7_9HYPH|nr:MBL fold metallo-hydrolase [Nitratireductor arenosus]
MLAACAGPGRNAIGEARFYANPDRPAPAPQIAGWTEHLMKMALKLFPHKDALPAGHWLASPEAETQFENGRGAALALTWFGHSTFLIRIGGHTVLTDPVLGNHVGPGRLHLHRLPPLRPDPGLIRRLDAIVISHADYDHLDIASLERLAGRFPDARVFVPEGTAFLVRRTGFVHVQEMRWYETAQIDGLSITAVPAIHGVRRPPFAIDSMHWAGFVIGDGLNTVYFAGDTAKDTMIFAGMRERLGPVDVALVPAGAWSPHHFQRPYHVDPDEAAALARTLGARLAIGMHWGTFALSEDPPAEQRRRFLAASTPQTRTTVFRIGETRVLEQ